MTEKLFKPCMMYKKKQRNVLLFILHYKVIPNDEVNVKILCTYELLCLVPWSPEHHLCCRLELDNRPTPSPCQHPAVGQSALLDGHFLLEDPEPPHADPVPPCVPAAGQVPHMGGDDQIHCHNTTVSPMFLLLSPDL